MLTRPPRPSGSRYWICASGTRTLPFATGSPSCLATRRRSSAGGPAGRGPRDFPLHLGVDADALDDAAPRLQLGFLGLGGPVDRHVVADLGPFDQARPGGLFGEPVFGGELLAALGSLASDGEDLEFAALRAFGGVLPHPSGTDHGVDRLPGGERVAAETSLGQVAHGDRAVDRHVGEGKFLALTEALPALVTRVELAPVASLTGFGLAGFVSVLLIAERAPSVIQIEDVTGPATSVKALSKPAEEGRDRGQNRFECPPDRLQDGLQDHFDEGGNEELDHGTIDRDRRPGRRGGGWSFREWSPVSYAGSRSAPG